MTSAGERGSNQASSILAKEFMEAAKELLTRDMVRAATRQEIEHHKRENHDLKQLVADLSLELHRFKKTAIPAFDGAAGAGAPRRGRTS